MNREQRRAFLAPTDTMVAKIMKDCETWEDRFGACCGCLQAMYSEAQKRGISQKEIMEEIGGELACRLIKALGSPPITEIHQYLTYFCSNSLAHKAAAISWARQHQDELLELQRQHPDIPLLEEVESAERRIQTVH